MPSDATTVIVVAAVIERGGRVLVARRIAAGTSAGRWEFPGGKVDSGEDPVAALRREIAEELGCSVAVHERIGPVVDIAAMAARGVSGELHAYLATPERGEPRAGDDHDEIRWIGADDLGDLDWLEADRPIAIAVAAHLRSESQTLGLDERVSG